MHGCNPYFNIEFLLFITLNIINENLFKLTEIIGIMGDNLCVHQKDDEVCLKMEHLSVLRSLSMEQ